MKKTEVMKRLKAAGNESARKTYDRHGVTGAAFGVRYADIYKLVKEIGTDQTLAEQLWATDNHDARILATMIADADRMAASALDKWVKTVNNQLALDAVAGLAAKGKRAQRCMEKWIEARHEWVASTGWHVLAAMSGSHDFEGAFFEPYIQRIETTIHDSSNRVKHSMNGALISIGCRSAPLRKQALAAAKRIGHVEVDHGDTCCKTPDAGPYIRKTAAHQAKKKRSSSKA